MLAGVAGSQAFYLWTVFGPSVYVDSLTVLGTTFVNVPILADAYWGWFASIVGMVLGLVLTVGVSAVTTPSTTENEAAYFDPLRAD